MTDLLSPFCYKLFNEEDSVLSSKNTACYIPEILSSYESVYFQIL